MTDQLLLDFDRAFDLHMTLAAVAEEIDGNRTALTGLLVAAERFVGPDPGAIDVHLRTLSELLREEGEDLARRLRMVALGGPEINAGLAALDEIRSRWHLIDNRGELDGNDGVISRSDLEWATEHLDGAASRAARWLLDHPEFFAAVETAHDNTTYLANAGAGFATDDGDTDGRLSLADIEAYVTKLDTWATLVPYMATIDVAAHGGELDGVMSKHDFEAFLDDQSLPPQVRQAAQNVLDDSAFHDTGGIGWDDVLMVASFVPVVGDFVDGAMALYYLTQGDWEQAALSAIGLVPIPGMTGGTVRGAKAAAEEAAKSASPLVTREMRETAVEWADGPPFPASALDGTNLRRSLVSESQLGDPHRLIAGAGSDRGIDVVNRLVDDYGGSAGDWMKLSSAKDVAPDGLTTEIHFYMRLGDETIYEPKTNFPTGQPWMNS